MRRFRELPLQRRFLLLLLPVLIGAPLAIGLFAEHTLQRALDRESQARLRASVRSEALPFAAELRAILSEVELAAVEWYVELERAVGGRIAPPEEVE